MFSPETQARTFLWAGDYHSAMATLTAAGYDAADRHEFVAWNRDSSPYGPLGGATSSSSAAGPLGGIAAVAIIVVVGLVVARR